MPKLYHSALPSASGWRGEMLDGFGDALTTEEERRKKVWLTTRGDRARLRRRGRLFQPRHRCDLQDPGNYGQTTPQ